MPGLYNGPSLIGSFFLLLLLFQDDDIAVCAVNSSYTSSANAGSHCCCSCWLSRVQNERDFSFLSISSRQVFSLSRVVKTMDVDIRRENEQQQMSETIS